MNQLLIDKAKSLSLDESLPEEVRNALLNLASAYRNRTMALELLTEKIDEFASYEKITRKHEDNLEDYF